MWFLVDQDTPVGASTIPEYLEMGFNGLLKEKKTQSWESEEIWRGTRVNVIETHYMKNLNNESKYFKGYTKIVK